MATAGNFSEYYKTISNTELLSILENPEDYQVRAIEAAKIEFGNRQLSEAEISIAKEPIIAKQIRKEKQQESIKLIENKLKKTGNSLFETLNPIQSETPATEKTIRFITLIFSGILIYTIFSSYYLILDSIRFFSEYPFANILLLLPFIILPVALYKFWKRKKSGWVLLSVYTLFSSVIILDSLISSINRDPALEVFFHRPAPNTYIIELLFLGGTSFALLKPDMRKVFAVDNQDLIITVLFGAAIPLTILYVMNQ